MLNYSELEIIRLTLLLEGQFIIVLMHSIFLFNREIFRNVAYFSIENSFLKWHIVYKMRKLFIIINAIFYEHNCYNYSKFSLGLWVVKLDENAYKSWKHGCVHEIWLIKRISDSTLCKFFALPLERKKILAAFISYSKTAAERLFFHTFSNFLLNMRKRFQNIRSFDLLNSIIHFDYYSDNY